MEDENLRLGLDVIKDLRHTSSRYFQDTLFKKKEKVMSYSSKRIPLGVKRDGSILYLDVQEGWRAFILGMAGSGKKN